MNSRSKKCIDVSQLQLFSDTVCPQRFQLLAESKDVKRLKCTHHAKTYPFRSSPKTKDNYTTHRLHSFSSDAQK